MPDPAFFKIDSRKISYIEYWRIVDGKLGTFLIAAIAKLLGSPLNFNTAIPRFDSLTLVEAAAVPGYAREAMVPVIENIRAQGPALQFLYTIPLLSLNTSFGAAFLSADGKTLPQLLYVKSGQNGSVTNSFSCVSKLSDGTLIATTDQKQKFNPAPWSRPLSMPGASVTEILAKHASRLKENKGPQPIGFTPETIEKFIVELNVREIDQKIARGLYVPMTSDEVERLRDQTAANP